MVSLHNLSCFKGWRKRSTKSRGTQGQQKHSSQLQTMNPASRNPIQGGTSLADLPVEYVRAMPSRNLHLWAAAFIKKVGLSKEVTIITFTNEQQKLKLSKEALAALSAHSADTTQSIDLFENSSIWYTAEWAFLIVQLFVHQVWGFTKLYRPQWLSYAEWCRSSFGSA